MAHPLLDEIHSIPPARHAERCKIGTYLIGLPVDDADALREALASQVSHASLSTLLRKYGIYVGPTLIGEHRREACACYRGAA